MYFHNFFLTLTTCRIRSTNPFSNKPKLYNVIPVCTATIYLLLYTYYGRCLSIKNTVAVV